MFSCVSQPLIRDIRDIPWESILGTSLVGATESKPKSLIESIRSSFIHLWFSLVCAAAFAHRNQFFPWYLHSISKANFKQLRNCCKRFMELVKLAYATKRRESISSQGLDSRDDWVVANTVLNEVTFYIPIQMNDFVLLLIRQSCFLKPLETQMLISQELSTSSLF